MDWQNFGRFLKQFEAVDAFQRLHEYFSLAENAILNAGGQILNIYGDDLIAIFPKERADDAINGLMKFRMDIGKWFKTKGINSKLKLSFHCDEIVLGMIKRQSGERLEALGQGIITCVMLQGEADVTLSPQAFRSLSADSRKSFKKYTPPIVYRAMTSA
jgi:class 3 adenylate cyclase